MSITPIDIRKKTFGTQLRGFSPREVEGFLELVASELEAQRKECGELSEKVDELTGRLEQYQRTEDLLKVTLVTAQKATEERRQAFEEQCAAERRKCEEDARAARADAEKAAREIVDSARADATRLREEIARLETERAALLSQIRGIAASFQALVERWEKPAAGERQ
ncbi:MAG: DivIVA domain-containing protein [bacterium]